MSAAVRTVESRAFACGVARERWRRWIPLAAFGVVFLGALLVALEQAPKPFYYDSAAYWGLPERLIASGRFSLLDLSDNVHGYAIGLLYYCVQTVGDALAWTASSEVKVFNALLFASIGGVLAPALSETVWPQRPWGLGRRALLAGLLLVFWSGYLNFPLSDFPALALSLVALVAVAKVDSPGWMLVAGLAGALALESRPAYVLLGPALVLLVAWEWRVQRGRSRRAAAHRVLCAAALAVGFAAGALPQSLAAHRNAGTWSFVPGASMNVAVDYFRPGLAWQRYDTYVGSGEPPQMAWEDETGKALLRSENGTIASTGQYLELVVGHPVQMAWLLARHVINGLDARYSTVYVERVEPEGDRWLRIGGFLLVFLALARLVWGRARRSLGAARWRYMAALLACCLTTIPTSTETRYLLPAYLSIYLLVLAPGWRDVVGREAVGLRRVRAGAIALLAMAAFSALILQVVDETTRQLVF